MNGKKPQLRFAGFEEDWEQKKLGEVCISFDYGLNVASKEFDGINKYIRITDIDDETRKFLMTDITSPNCDIKLVDNYRLQKGDIVFARTGASVGKTYIYKENDGIIYYAGFLIKAKVKNDIYSEFIFYTTLTKHYEKFINITSQRSGQPGVNAQEYSQFEFFIPWYEEQKKIGIYFTYLDNFINMHQSKYDKLTNIKRAMLEKMFPKNGADVPEIRFKGFSDAWEWRKLGELVDRVVRKNTNNESSLPLTISAQYGLVDQVTYFNNRVASHDVSNYYLVLQGEFAYNKSTSDGFSFGAVKRLDLYEKGVLSTLYIVFALKNPIKTNSDFMTVFFDTNRWHKGVSERAAEGARNHGLLNISAEDFFDIDIQIPKSENEQAKIGTYFYNLDKLIKLHQCKLEKLKNIKKACMEKMFV